MNGAPDGGSDVALDMPFALDATAEQVPDAPQVDTERGLDLGGTEAAMNADTPMPDLDATPEQVPDASQIDAPIRACMKLSGPMDVNTGDALFTLLNSCLDVTLTDVALSVGHASIVVASSSCGASLAASASCSIVLQLVAPQGAPPQAIATVLTASARESSPATIPVVGRIAPSLDSWIQPTALSFGVGWVGFAFSKGVSVTNGGTTPTGQLSATVTWTGPAVVEVTQNDCSVLEPGASCSLVLTYTPTDVWPAMSGRLLVTDGTLSLEIPLAGIGLGLGLDASAPEDPFQGLYADVPSGIFEMRGSDVTFRSRVQSFTGAHTLTFSSDGKTVYIVMVDSRTMTIPFEGIVYESGTMTLQYGKGNDLSQMRLSKLDGRTVARIHWVGDMAPMSQGVGGPLVRIGSTPQDGGPSPD